MDNVTQLNTANPLVQRLAAGIEDVIYDICGDPNGAAVSYIEAIGALETVKLNMHRQLLRESGYIE